jgi:formiminotetrahydrofolate cyclodeaminase
LPTNVLPAFVPESLEPFLERVAAGTPTPGGGTVSAVCGALSAALSRMVANVAVGKKGYEAVASHLSEVEQRGRALQMKFLVLAGEDARAYDEVVAAMKLPKDTPDQRGARMQSMQTAYKRATEVPLETIRMCIEALELAKLAAEKGSRSAITDVGMAAILAQAAMRGAALNVRINLSATAYDEWRVTREAETEQLLKRGAQLADEANALVESRL